MDTKSWKDIKDTVYVKKERCAVTDWKGILNGSKLVFYYEMRGRKKPHPRTAS